MTTSADVQGIFTHDVLPILFPTTDDVERPALIVTAGAPGTMPSRAIGRAIDDGSAVTRVSAEVLRPFHPAHLNATDRDAEARIDDAVSEWLLGAMNYAREYRRSIAIDGVLDVDLAIALAKQYAGAGFETHLIAVAAPASKALLAGASFHADATRSGRTTPIANLSDFELGASHTAELLSAAQRDGAFDRVTVFDDRGQTVFDEESAAVAREIFEQASRRAMTGLEVAQWLGELRRVTEYARELRVPPRPLVDVLIEIHQIALQVVIRELPVPPGSEVTGIEDDRLATNLTALRRLVASEQAPATPGPVLSPPERGGLGR